MARDFAIESSCFLNTGLAMRDSEKMTLIQGFFVCS
jgi:hypothetical protein